MNSYFRRRSCGCGTFRPWRSHVPRNSTLFSAYSRGRGFSNGELEHVLPTNKKTGSLNLKTTSCNMPDDFFLRPFLTREEFSFWNSHFGGLSSSCSSSASSCGWSCACALNTKGNTTVTYQHMKPSVCARNGTGQPCTKPLLGTKSISDGFCSDTGLVTKPSVPKKVASTASCARMEANALGCYYSMSTSSNMKSPSGCTLNKDKGVFNSPSADGRSILPPHQTGSSRLNSFSNNGNSTRGCGVQQPLTPELRRRLSERYLCGDMSFEENPVTRSTSTHHEDPKTGSADPCNPSNTSVTSSELVTADHCPLKKRKPTSGSENVSYPKENGKRARVCDDVEETNKAQEPNETIDLNDTLTNFLNGLSLPRSICRGKNASFKINESRGKRRSRGMKRSRGVSKRCVQGRPAGKNNTSITSDGRCEINSAKKANYEHGVETHCITQPKIVRTFSLADVEVKSRDGELALTDGNKPPERKHNGDVINAEKPVQRGLLKNTKSFLRGSYALDYESLPKLVSVLSSPMAKVVSNLKT